MQTRDRKQVINEVLGNLMNLKTKTSSENLYAIEANIEFFKASKLLWQYIKWLLFRAPKLESQRLLEINDLLPEYDNEIHEKLIEVEKKQFPGLIELVVKHLVNHIIKADKPMVVTNFGSGGMETEKQVISRLLVANHKHRIIFIGIDQSSIAHSVAKNNLINLSEFIDNHETKNLDSNYVDRLRGSSAKQYKVIYCQHDIFTLDNFFPPNYFDVSFHTLFKHHLDDDKKIQLDNLLSKLSRVVFEYDGFKTWLATVPQTIVGWNNPIFLNAEIFSNLRFESKRDIIKKNSNDQYIVFSRIGYYLKRNGYFK